MHWRSKKTPKQSRIFSNYESDVENWMWTKDLGGIPQCRSVARAVKSQVILELGNWEKLGQLHLGLSRSTDSISACHGMGCVFSFAIVTPSQPGLCFIKIPVLCFIKICCVIKFLRSCASPSPSDTQLIDFIIWDMFHIREMKCQCFKRLERKTLKFIKLFYNYC